jgi:hypothetical protein
MFLGINSKAKPPRDTDAREVETMHVPHSLLDARLLHGSLEKNNV